MFFFFKQKTAYEMRISDWSSDVCSSDLPDAELPRELDQRVAHMLHQEHCLGCRLEAVSLSRKQCDSEPLFEPLEQRAHGGLAHAEKDRKRVVEGKGVSVRVDLGGRQVIKKKT